ncbi:histidinol-phosphate transaminase [Halothiobacillus diazotrophicus]|uniref:Histidinol-phosphate aminotransferase n=1 Tax=Halothiobacillus diazotrophicus TaxID=1860122 RepID=A0A191ZE78_9GAMM|nr:histidinol-phosphate transaminase [Halothiobacillus diazotrophicus]ANJ66172.1 histidinol-phosphate transaminase [Halothiobacillus diazotrophicus]
MSQSFWSPIVHELTPYVPGEQPKGMGLVKLNTNENPYGPSPKVLAAISSVLNDTLRLYPDPTASELRQTIAEYYALSPNQVFVGNGSDEVLAFVFQSLLAHGRPVLFPDISYSFYPVYCQLYGIEYRAIPIDDQMAIVPKDYFGAEATGIGGIVFPNPNAPTGRLMSLLDIERLVAGHPGVVVVVDEAYIDFGGQSAVTLIDRYPNLLVTQSLSKSRSLAGLRVGLALGHPDLIEALVRVKDSFNSYPLDRLALVGAQAAFLDTAYFEETRQRIMDDRDGLTAALKARGFEVIPSAANFVFARHPQYSGAELYQGLRAQSVIVRHFNKPRIADFLRITVGTTAQNQALLTALDRLVAP